LLGRELGMNTTSLDLSQSDAWMIFFCFLYVLKKQIV